MAKESKTRENKKSQGRLRWRLLFGLAAAGALGMSTAMAARRVQRYVTTAPQFLLSRDRRDAVVVDGITYASRWKVRRVFANDYDRSIFSIPLPERRRRLLAIDWVEDASVSRIWPDRLVVHIRERRPVAFVHLRSGFVLIDRNGILMEQPKHARFAFPVLSGITDAESETERARRVGAKLGVFAERGAAAQEVSGV
jgi:cell division protein FtsQ